MDATLPRTRDALWLAARSTEGVIRVLRSVPDRLTSRRGAWLWIVLVLLVMTAVWGMLGRTALLSGNDTAPADSESAQVTALATHFPHADRQAVLIVASAAGGGALSPDDRSALSALVPVVTEQTGATAAGPLISDDGRAAVIQTTIAAGDTTAQTTKAVTALRATIAEHPMAGVELQVTGGPAFGADIASAFDGADLTLLLVTLAIVALLLIVTYRSPVLWIVPLAVVAVADQMAGKVTAAVGNALSLQFDAGIISVLVFGAGTNYALLLVSRYREELARTTSHRAALATAWRCTAPAIVASNVTVVLALFSLVLAVIPGTRGLGVASAIGLAIALATVLFALPPILAVCGRRVFWPFIPRVGGTGAQGRLWRGVATSVVRRPWLPLVGGIALLTVMASGLLGAAVGLTQVEKFRVPSESAAGLQVLGDHFPAGEAQPMVVVVNTAAKDAVTRAITAVDGVVRVTPAGASSEGALTRLLVTGEPAPGTPQSLALVTAVRATAHAVPGGDALVGGPVATDLDARAGNLRDVTLIVPLVLGICLVVLTVLLRSLIAPVLLLAVNIASAVAAIGAGAWLGRVLFGWHALDLQVPLLSFLFLVALGIDYTIFLVHRARTESRVVGTRAGMVTALASTGGVITSAGIVLAAVFAALGVLPLVTLGQLGLIVGVGVIVDTFVVRTLVVPAIFALVGERIWWPRRPAPVDASPAQHAESEDEVRVPVAVS